MLRIIHLLAFFFRGGVLATSGINIRTCICNFVKMKDLGATELVFYSSRKLDRPYLEYASNNNRSQLLRIRNLLLKLVHAPHIDVAPVTPNVLSLWYEHEKTIPMLRVMC